jgi:hypothetical protein
VKQRISVEQLQELTEEQKQRLRELWKPQFYDVVIDNNKYDVIIVFHGGMMCSIDVEMQKRYTKADCLPAMSIGQMIEILESKFPTLYIENQLPAGLRESIRYRIFQQGAGPHYGDTLCDALWQAVKEVL